MRKKLSVVIPVYNAEKYLSECIESVINQTYKPIEILLIDDGSTDTSLDICQRYAQEYDDISCIHQENKGCVITRNVGINSTTSDYFAFLDADDCIDRDFYEILIDRLERYKCDISACGFIREYGKITVKEKNDRIPKAVVFENKKEVLESLTSENDSIEGYLWNKVWKRECLENVLFRNDVAIVEDAIFSWDAIVKNIDRACYTNLPMHHYRIIQTSVTRNSEFDNYYKALHAYEIMINDAKKINPNCLEGLCTDYIIWNIKLCEQMILQSNYSDDTYINVKKNIENYSDYISKCHLRHRILANAILKEWNNYKRKAIFFCILKKIYMGIKAK